MGTLRRVLWIWLIGGLCVGKEFEQPFETATI